MAKYQRALKEEDWESLDKVFGFQRLTGTNPAVIQRVMPNADDANDATNMTKDLHYVMTRYLNYSISHKIK